MTQERIQHNGRTERTIKLPYRITSVSKCFSTSPVAFHVPPPLFFVVVYFGPAYYVGYFNQFVIYSVCLMLLSYMLCHV